MKKTMRGYSWICLVAGFVWLACGQMEANAWWREPPIWLACTNCDNSREYYKKGEAYPCDDKPRPGKPKLTLRDAGDVSIQDTPVAFYPPKGAPLEFTMIYNSHGGMDYLNLDNGGGGWMSILGFQWTHSFEWSLQKSGDDYTLVIPGKQQVHFTENGGTFTAEDEKPWRSWHSSERYEAEWLTEGGVTHILVRKAFWNTMQCSQKKGCTTCGGNGGGNQSDIPHPPYSAWHADEGFVFELVDGQYRLLRKISRDGEALTCSYTNNLYVDNLLSVVSNTLGDKMSFYYEPFNNFEHAFLTNIQVSHAGAVIRSASFTCDDNDGVMTSVTDMATNTFNFTHMMDYPNSGGSCKIASMSSPSSSGYETITIDHGMVPASSSWTSDWTQVAYPEGDWRRVDLQRSGDRYLLIDSRPGSTNVFYFSTNAVAGASVPTNSVDALGRVTQYDFDLTNSVGGPYFFQPHLRARINPDGTREEYVYTNEYRRIAAVRYYTAPTNGTDRQLYQEEKWYYTDFSCVQCADVITNEVWGLDRTNGWSLLSRKVTDYARYDRDTVNNPADDVYVLASEMRWIDANTFAETRYLYDTNTFLMTNVQQRTSSNGDFRTVQNFRWNQTNQLTEVVDALNYTNGVAYDDYYRVASVWQYRTNLVTRFTYDSLDQVLTKVYPDNTKEAWTYNSCLCGFSSHTNRDGGVSQTFYDRNERVSHRSTRTAVGTLLSSESYEYDYNGRITNTWDAASNVVQRVYNAAGELINEIDHLNRTNTYVYSDQTGQLIKEIRPDETFTSNRYDIAGRVVEVCQYDSYAHSLATNQYGYDGMGRQIWTKDALGNVTSNEYDMLSRVIRATYPDGSYSALGYDLLGNLVWQQQNGMTIMIISYDELNRRRATVNALNQTNKWTYDPAWPNQVQSRINATGSVVVVNTYAPLTGLLTNQVRMGVTNFLHYDIGGQIDCVTFGDGTVASRFYDGPRMTSQVDRAGYANDYRYDILGRVTNVLVSGQVKQVLAYDEVGNLSYQYDALDRLQSFNYDEMNRRIQASRFDGCLTNQYDALGRMTNQVGAGRLPVAYGYDAMGHMTNLVDGEGNPTQWKYDSMGRMTSKIYADNKSWSYGYNGNGWLTNRMDGNQAVTYYTYDALGQLTNIHYAVAGMTNVSMGYDKLGRMTSRVDAAGTWSWTYVGDSSLKATEQLDAAWDGSGDYTVAYGYNALLELTNVSVNGTSVQQYTWLKGRLDKVYAPALGKTNQYHWNAIDNRLDGWEVVDGGLTNKRTYDAVGQLLGTTNYGVNGVISGFAYTYDEVGRRTQRLDNQTVTNVYGYDYADQLTNAVRHAMSNHAANAAYNYTYEYDAIGNRSVGKRRNLIYDGTYNNLNQLMTLSVTGKVPVYGESAVTNIRVSSTNVQVSVYDEAPGKCSWLGDVGIPTTNRGSGQMDIGISAWDGTNHTVTNVMVYLPPENPQPFQYDDNGNLLDDGLREYSWDAENRLIAVEVKTNMSLPQVRSEYIYDAQGRRVRAVDYVWDTNSNDFVATNTRQFVYDGWNLIAEKGNGYTNFMAWALDLSGTLQGAGGVGGLLASCQSGGNSAVYYLYDGNGNVTDLVDSNGAVVGHYDYDPFGNTVAMSGAMAQSNSFRFSTKYFETQWNLYYYGYRYYSPRLGRWINRDPIGDQGGVNLYGFVLNDPLLGIDRTGLNLFDGLSLGEKEKSDGKKFVFTKVKVGKCEIVVLYGHGSSEVGHEFDFGRKDCRAGEFVGCYPGVTNERIEDENQLPGCDMCKASKYGGRGADEAADAAGEGGSNFDADVRNAKARALTKAEEICQDPKKCCPHVHIQFKKSGDGSDPINWPIGDYSGLSEKYPCRR